MEEADQLCDRVAIMDHGRILALDTPAALKRIDRRRTASCASRPTATSTQLADAPLADRRGRHRRPGRRRHDRPLGRRRSGLLPRVIDAADQLGVAVTDLSVSEPTLETVFINLTGKDLRE